MANINISDFRRPGIYIREIDASVRQVPAQTQTINLVVGFSKKGPINRPILISTPQELLDVFGDIDRNMEKKGCFFHRTILNVLRSSPVYALNLLNTDDELDQLEYTSLSTSSDVSNKPVDQAPYSSFFDRADFWYKDTESFLNIAKSDDHILHIANLSDKKMSVFMFKSPNPSNNDTLSSHYGGGERVPQYLNSTDLVSDYMVDVLVVAGDWSDYNALSVDTRWSRYFNKNGLRKNEIQNFSNDSAVSILSNYRELSLIPYFRDSNNRDRFIETVINSDTDRTGLFVSYDINSLEDSDYSKGLLDLVGNNIVGENVDTIDYLSYRENITETVVLEETALDRAGNSFGSFNLNMETKLDGSISFSQTSGSGFTEIDLDTVSLSSYILNGLEIKPDETQAKAIIDNVSIGKIRKDTIYLDDNGAIGVEQGFEVSNQTLWDDVALRPVATGLLPIAVVYVGGQGTSGGLSINYIETLDNLTVGDSSSTADILVSYTGTNSVTFTFAGTKNSDSDENYRKTKLNMIFNQLLSNITSGVSIIKTTDGDKVTITDFNFITDASENKSLTIRVAPSININNGVNSEIFFEDDEQTFRPESGTESFGVRTEIDSEYGVAAESSALYRAYSDGVINSGDYFYPNLFENPFGKVEFYKQDGNDYISLYFNLVDGIDTSKFNSRRLKFVGTDGNDNIFTVLTNSVQTGISGDFDTKIDLIVNESVKTETNMSGEITVHGASESDIRYLKLYMINNNLNLEFSQAEDLSTTNPLDTTVYNLNKIIVFSRRSNFKQNLEIESILETNKVLVDAQRYGNVRVGDYLKAYVDESSLGADEVPKRLTRVVSKRLYAADATKLEISTDAQIDITYFGNDPQTFRYTNVENYVSNYNAVVLKGFKMRGESLPDGTESRQNDILNLIAKGTPIFKGLVNRNKLSWRYLVDSWGMGLTANSKQQLVDLCGERLTAFGILNMPSAKDFKNSTLTNFLDSDKTLSTSHIANGGDPESNPSFLYSFGQGKGQSNVAYFFPHVTITDNGRPATLPPASFILNTFMRKHTSNLASVKPWTVAAGLTNGLLTGFGNVEMDLTPDDIINLNSMNANPIVYKINRGFVIETDNTAQLVPRSALSNTHVREALIELEEEMYQMLLTYQWRFNTPEVRSEIKAKADAICERYVRERGLYDFENIMDETNNTGDLIDAQIGVLDTFVEPVKAMGIIVNNITILKTGDIQAGGFRNV